MNRKDLIVVNDWSNHTEKVIKAISKKSSPRIVGYNNKLNWAVIGKYGDHYNLFVDLNPEGLKIKYKDNKISKYNEQFKIQLNKKQALSLYNALKMRLE